MNVGKVMKDTGDVRRITVEFLKWLDDGEQISAVSTPTIALDTGRTVGGNGVLPSAEDDTSTLVLDSHEIMAGAQRVQLMVSDGTPGFVYKIKFFATGSTSGRVKQTDLFVLVRAAL